MKCSFIIASINRNQQLQECIKSIEKAHEYKKDCTIEILIVLQDGKRAEDNIKLMYPELTTFYIIDQRGLSKARNYAIRKSKGDSLIFLDDDAQIKEDFLEVLSENCLGLGAEAFCGRILEQNTNRIFSVCFANSKKKYLKRSDFRYFMGSSHIFRRSTIQKIGLYDERFGAGAQFYGAEESDMFFRVMRQEEKVIYVPELIFYHPISHETSASKVFNYSYAVGAVLTKQIFFDRTHLLVYLSILAKIILKGFLRVIQGVFFIKSVENRNKQFHYKSALSGIFKGIYGYVRSDRVVPAA